MTSEIVRTLSFSDIHLNREEDFDFEMLEKWLEKRELREKLPDVVTVHGDVIDNIPRDREEIQERERDIELGRYFFGRMGDLGREYGFKILAVSGNHDSDIHQEILRHEEENYENIHNLNEQNVYGPDIDLESNFVFIGYGAESFDIGPEVPIEEIESIQDISPQELEEILNTSINSSAEHVASKFEPDIDNLREVIEGVRHYHENYEKLSDNLEMAQERTDIERNVLISHIAPFNTKLDRKSIGGQDYEHQGSIALKNAVKNAQPGLLVSGHHDYESLDTVNDEFGYTTILLGLDGEQAYELTVGLEENSLSFSYSRL